MHANHHHHPTHPLTHSPTHSLTHAQTHTCGRPLAHSLASPRYLASPCTSAATSSARLRPGPPPPPPPQGVTPPPPPPAQVACQGMPRRQIASCQHSRCAVHRCQACPGTLLTHRYHCLQGLLRRTLLRLSAPTRLCTAMKRLGMGMLGRCWTQRRPGVQHTRL